MTVPFKQANNKHNILYYRIIPKDLKTENSLPFDKNII